MKKLMLLMQLANLLLIGVSSEDTLCQYSGRQWQNNILDYNDVLEYSTIHPYKDWMVCSGAYKLGPNCAGAVVSCEKFSTVASKGCRWGDYISIIEKDTGSYKRFCRNKGPLNYKPKGDFKLRFVSNGRKTAYGVSCQITCPEPIVPPVDCVETNWNTWSICSKTCGGGSRSRQRSVEKEEANGGESCGDLSQDEPCNTQACLVDCILEGEWSEWSSCTAECKKTRNKKVLTPASNGGTCDSEQSQVCFSMLHYDSCCGIAKKTSRVQGGTETSINQYPWMVLIENERDQYKCAGALISDQWILTASSYHSSCLTHDTYEKIVLGDHDLTKSDETSSLEVTYTEKIRRRTLEEDEMYGLVLIKLSSPVDFSAHENIRPICLPTENKEANYVGVSAIVAAWGQEMYDDTNYNYDYHSDVLKETTLTIRECGDVDIDPEDYFCGKHVSDTTGPCKNDYGAPLMKETDTNRFEVIGIFEGCGGDWNVPGSGNGQFYKIAGTQAWIRENTNLGSTPVNSP